jgi:hypothetical protein
MFSGNTQQANNDLKTSYTIPAVLEFQITRKHNMLESGLVSVFSSREEDTFSVGSLRKS